MGSSKGEPAAESFANTDEYSLCRLALSRDAAFSSDNSLSYPASTSADESEPRAMSFFIDAAISAFRFSDLSSVSFFSRLFVLISASAADAELSTYHLYSPRHFFPAVDFRSEALSHSSPDVWIFSSFSSLRVSFLMSVSMMRRFENSSSSWENSFSGDLSSSM